MYMYIMYIYIYIHIEDSTNLEDSQKKPTRIQWNERGILFPLLALLILGPPCCLFGKMVFNHGDPQ